MKHIITFEGISGRTPSGFLLHIAVVFHQLRISPESFVWSEIPSGGEVRLWIVVAEETGKVEQLVEALKCTDGARNVHSSVEDPGVRPPGSTGLPPPDDPPMPRNGPAAFTD